MPSKKYFDLDINKLFEEHSIKDIEEIQKTIQHESDRKKIELRTLVGERYRDLIQAADTIAEMKETSKDVIRRIADIETTFRDLQRKYLIGFKIDTEDTSAERNSQNVSDFVVMQIKILMDVPEHIWSAVDNKDFLLAAQLFILAQHVNYGLSFDIGQSLLINKYPIVSKQWSIISHFRNVIFNQCNETLQVVDLPTEVAANCLAALFLLDGTKSKDLLEKLINSRCQAIESIIKDENPRSVRQRIKLSVKLLTHTIVLVHSCFINDQTRGSIALRIKKLTNQRASGMLENLDLDNEMLEKYLPSVTKSYKPFESNEFDDLDAKDLSIILKNWFQWIEELTSREITRLLSLVTSVKGIYNIREETLSLELPSDWESMINDLSLPRTNFWQTYYQRLLTTRVKEIMKFKLEDSTRILKENLTDLLTKISSEKYEFPEYDLRWYIWKDSASDIPEKLSKNFSDEISKKSLLLKSLAFSPNLMLVFRVFDDNLNRTLDDLEQYLYESDKNISTNDLLSLNFNLVFDKFVDRTELQDHLQNTCFQIMEESMQFVERNFISPETKIGNYSTNLIFFARFFQALTTLSPSLKKCFNSSRISSRTCTKWLNLSRLAKEESTKIWLLWAKDFRKIVEERLKKHFKDENIFHSSDVASIVSEWERVTIEEEAEEGKRIQSEIFVPYQASVYLLKFLANVSGDLNKIIPHTLPKKVLHEIIERIVEDSLDRYEKIINDSNVGQKKAFQILFDLKFITLLMVPRDNKFLTDRSTLICNIVFSKIDPFDSDVFYPFIHLNVKKSVQRSLLIFGNLVPHIEQLHSVLGSRSDYPDNSKTVNDPPGGLAVCTGAPWFPPLAVTAPTRNLPLMTVSVPDKTQKKRTPVKEAAKNDFSGATIKSGAAAFFGAMGSDWFGTS